MSNVIIKYNADVSAFTTFHIPARAAALVSWRDESDLQIIRANSSLPRPLKAIGEGSNLLITAPFKGSLLLREGSPELVINKRELSVYAAANITLDLLCQNVAENNFRGLENLSGIPGTLGGALVQNAGAYGAEIGDSLISLTAFDLNSGEFVELSRNDMHYSYRSSKLKSEPERFIITAAKLQLRPPTDKPQIDYGNLREALADTEPTPMAVREAVLKIRNAKLPDPKLIGSAGSFFRNPEVCANKLLPDMPRYDIGNGLFKVPAAWLIDHAGLKNASVGGASVWTRQPLVIVNSNGNASAADILALESEIIESVKQKFNITLQPEVEHI